MENFAKHFPRFTKREYKDNPILCILLDVFLNFMKLVPADILHRIQAWLHSFADMLPIVHEALHGSEDWTPTESQQASMSEWNEVNEGIRMPLLRGIDFHKAFAIGVRYPKDISSTYVYFCSSGNEFADCVANGEVEMCGEHEQWYSTTARI